MAPEIHAKQLFDAKKADVFALGVMLYQLVVGRLPFKRATGIDEAYKHISNEDYPLFWSQTDKNIRPDSLKPSRHLRSLLQAMLSADPDQRPTADEVLKHKWMAQRAPDVALVVQELGITDFYAFSENNHSTSETCTSASSDSDSSSKPTQAWPLRTDVEFETVVEAIRTVFTDAAGWMVTGDHPTISVSQVSDNKL